MAHAFSVPALVAGSTHGFGNAAGEGLEELARDLIPIYSAVHAEGKSGIEAAIAIAGRIDWPGLIAKTGAHYAAQKVTRFTNGPTGIQDPVTRFLTTVVIENLLAGAAVGGIDKLAATLSNPAEVQKYLKDAVAKVVPTITNPNGGISALTWDDGPGSDLVHYELVDGAGNPVSYPGRGFSQSCCSMLGHAVRDNDLRYSASNRNGGNNNGRQQQQQQPQRHELIVRRSDLPTALRIKGHVCEQCRGAMPLATAASTQKTLTFWQKVNGSDAVKDVLAALRHHAATHPRPHIATDHLEDVARLDFDALRILCESFHARVTQVTDPQSGAVQFVEMDEMTAKEFVIGLDSIGTELKFSNRADEAAHNAWEKVKHAWEHGGPAAWGLAALALILPVGYFLSAVPIAGIYGAGLFGWWKNQHLNIGLTGVGAILALLWFIPWYTVTGLKGVFGGIFQPNVDTHGSPTLTNTARAVTAFLFGLGVTAILIADVGIMFNFSTYVIRFIVIPVIALAIIAYNRIGASNQESQAVRALMEQLSLGNIKTLSAVSAVLVVIAVGPLAYIEYVASNTMFRLAVEKTDIDGTSVFYVPTPDGRVFRIEDLFGQLKANEIETSMTGDRMELCLPLGTVVDLPGYTEKTVEGCKDGEVGYAIRTNPLGMKIGGASSYDSLESLAAAEKASDKAPAQTVRAAAPEPPKAMPVATAQPAPEPTQATRPLPRKKTTAATARTEKPRSKSKVPDMFK